MRFILSALAALLVLGSCATVHVSPGPHPALFAVRDADSTIYLFGTVHVRQAGAAWGGPEAVDALQQSGEVWTEIDISPVAELALQAQVLRLGMADAQHPLSSLLNPEENAKLDALSQRLGIPRAGLDRMQPWFAAITLSLLPVVQAGYDPMSGVDRAVDAVADEAGKTRRAFETGAQQIEFLAGLSPEAQHEMLLDAINEADAGAGLLDDLTAAWEKGDVDTLDKLIVQDMRADFLELYDVLMRRRNLAWAETLAHEMDGSGTDFVAVGAGHLVGDDGLVALLRARGYHVERVRAR